MNRNSVRQRIVRGFTLLELLVAIAIFAVLSVFAYEGLRNFLTARTSIEQHDAEFLRVAKGVNTLQQDFESVVGRPVRDALGDPQAAVDGTGDGNEHQLALTRHTAWSPLGDLATDLKRIEYRLEKGEMIRRMWSVLDRVSDSQFTERVILDQVASINILYFDQGEWLRSWPRARGATDLARLPRAISVEIGFADGRGIKRLFLVAGAG